VCVFTDCPTWGWQVQVDFFERAVAAAAGQGGALSDRTARALSDLTHAGMFAFFEATWGWSRARFEASGAHNCNGAFSAWSSRGDVGLRVMEDWVACALEKQCVCPEKSNRGNHRQDQAALSLAMAMHGLTCHGPGLPAAQAAQAARAVPPVADAAPPVVRAAASATAAKSALSDPSRVHWVRTHATRPKHKTTAAVLAAHAPKCVAAYEAAGGAAAAAAGAQVRRRA
jgi:hypothetical protein